MLTVVAWVVLVTAFPASEAVQCMGKNNKPVDWFIIYKMPVYNPGKYHNHDYPFPPHFYLDESMDDWMSSDTPLNQTDQALSYSLEAFYKNQSEVGYVLYNDQVLRHNDCTDEPAEGHGHTKGLIVFDAKSGIWIVHSTPCFPFVKESGYGFPHNGFRYGQHFMCVSLAAGDIDGVGYQLRMNDPYLFESYMPFNLGGQYGNVSMLVNHNKSGLVGTSHVFQFKVGRSQTAKSFAKDGHFGKDLYAGLVAPTLEDSLVAETWQHDRKLNYNATCDQDYKVLDATKITMDASNLFDNSKDHSKFAVGMKSDWACVGDINRQTSQARRGGGTVCLNNPTAAKSYRKIITGTDKCPSAKGHV